LRKKLVNGLLFVSLASVFSAPCLDWAETFNQTPVAVFISQSARESAKLSQEEALAIARKAFNISQAYQNVQIEYINDDYFGRKYWQFSWNLQQANGYRGIMVAVDGTTGTILNYSDYSEWQPGQTQLKLKSEQECARIAENLAKALVPDKLAQCKSKKYPYPGYSMSGPQIYNFFWERQVNGIPFCENSIVISVNAETGKVNSYQLNWDDNSVFPDPGKAISTEEAQQVFRSKQGVKLIYNRRSSPYYPLPNQSKQPAELYYSIGDSLTGFPTFIDALSGQLVDATGTVTKVAEQVYLQPLPELPVTKAAAPLSLLEAQTKLSEYLPNLNLYTVQSSQLNETWGPSGDKTWQFQLQRSDSVSDPGYSLAINAFTGDLVHLNRFQMGPEIPQSSTPKLSYQECKKLAQAYVAKVTGKKADYLSLVENPIQTPNIMSYNGVTIVQPIYYFSFTRVVNGIHYGRNNLSLEVNNQTGEVMSYYLNWESSATFAPPENLITPQQAIDSILQAGKPQLYYYRQLDNSGRNSGKIGLTYRFLEEGLGLIDAKTGKVVSPWLEEPPVKLTDIGGHPSEKAVKALCSMGILDGSAAKFYPDKGVTRAEMAKILVMTKGLEPDSSSSPKFRDVPNTAWYFGWVQAAAKAGLVKGANSRFNPDQVVTREEMVVMMIRVLKVPNQDSGRDLIEENYLDGDKIAPWAKGSYNLAAQLGLLSSRKGYLAPHNRATRGEAAVMLERLIDNANRNGWSMSNNQ
ncbi:MAG TPA: S-layer homology domain-containing protein, partial [Bacillota bacterium]|nr:S-layer homology domain-containing protein [Bacillota bacterium]